MSKPTKVDHDEVDEPSICPDCEGDGSWFDDGEYDPRTRKMVGGGIRACRTCNGTGIVGNEE